MLTISHGNCGFEFNFFSSRPKKLKTIENLGHFNFRDLFGMFTNGCEPWTTFYHILLDKLEKQAKFSDFLEI